MTVCVELRVKSLREAAGLTQRDLAKSVGVNCSTVCKWESGAIYPTADRIPKIADTLHCTIDELFGRKGKTAS